MPDNINDKVNKAAEPAAEQNEGLNLLSAMRDGVGDKKDVRSAEDIQREMDELAPKIEAARKAVEEKMAQIATYMKDHVPADLHQSMAEWMGYHAEQTSKK